MRSVLLLFLPALVGCSPAVESKTHQPSYAEALTAFQTEKVAFERLFTQREGVTEAYQGTIKTIEPAAATAEDRKKMEQITANYELDRGSLTKEIEAQGKKLEAAVRARDEAFEREHGLAK